MIAPISPVQAITDRKTVITYQTNNKKHKSVSHNSGEFQVLDKFRYTDNLKINYF